MKQTFISKTDLGQAYFPYIDPKSARHKLMSLIKDDDTLMTLLLESGYKPEHHTFSPVQVGYIIDRYGNPWK